MWNICLWVTLSRWLPIAEMCCPMCFPFPMHWNEKPASLELMLISAAAYTWSLHGNCKVAMQPCSFRDSENAQRLTKNTLEKKNPLFFFSCTTFSGYKETCCKIKSQVKQNTNLYLTFKNCLLLLWNFKLYSQQRWLLIDCKIGSLG